MKQLTHLFFAAIVFAYFNAAKAQVKPKRAHYLMLSGSYSANPEKLSFTPILQNGLSPYGQFLYGYPFSPSCHQFYIPFNFMRSTLNNPKIYETYEANFQTEKYNSTYNCTVKYNDGNSYFAEFKEAFSLLSFGIKTGYGYLLSLDQAKKIKIMPQLNFFGNFYLIEHTIENNIPPTLHKTAEIAIKDGFDMGLSTRIVVMYSFNEHLGLALTSPDIMQFYFAYATDDAGFRSNTTMK